MIRSKALNWFLVVFGSTWTLLFFSGFVYGIKVAIATLDSYKILMLFLFTLLPTAPGIWCAFGACRNLRATKSGNNDLPAKPPRSEKLVKWHLIALGGLLLSDLICIALDSAFTMAIHYALVVTFLSIPITLAVHGLLSRSRPS